MAFATTVRERLAEAPVKSPFLDKVVLVAGGTGGLGRAVSLAFLSAGARVAVTYRRQEELAALEAVAGPARERLEGHAVDVTDEAATRALLAAVWRRHGRLDALVNAVGGFAGGKKLWEEDAGVLHR